MGRTLTVNVTSSNSQGEYVQTLLQHNISNNKWGEIIRWSLIPLNNVQPLTLARGIVVAEFGEVERGHEYTIIVQLLNQNMQVIAKQFARFNFPNNASNRTIRLIVNQTP